MASKKGSIVISALFQNTINYFSRLSNNAFTVPRSKQYSGEYSRDLPFSRFYDYYHQTPPIKRNINSIHKRWMGSSQEVKSQSKVFDQMWQLWCDATKFWPKLKVFALDTLITGTGMLERQYYQGNFANISHIPTKTLWRIYRDEFGNVLSIWQQQDGDTKQLSPDYMLIFTINNPENDAIGKSAMYAVATPQKVAGKVDELGNPINPDRYLPSILDVKMRLNYAHMEAAEKSAKNRWFVSLKNIKDKDRQQQIEKDLENEASSKYITVVSEDVSAVPIQFNPQVGNLKYIEDIDKQINQASGFPGNVIDETQSGFASSQTPLQDLSMSIEDMQNDLSQMVQDYIFKPLCEQWNLDYNEVQPKLIFNTFVEKISFEMLIKIPVTAPLTDNELRAAYAEFMPGMGSDADWEAFKKKNQQEKMEIQQNNQKMSPEDGKKRPDIEKEAPKPETTSAENIIAFLKNPKALENHVQKIVNKAIENGVQSYFALPPVNGQPYQSAPPEVSNQYILDRVKKMMDQIKSGNLVGDDIKKEAEDIAKESDAVGKWIDELKKAHPTWKHDQVVAVAIQKVKSGESVKRLDKMGTDYWNDKEIQKQLAVGVQVEMEHTDNPEQAIAIAMDHLSEYPDYYTRLSKVVSDVPKIDSKEAEDVYNSIQHDDTIKSDEDYGTIKRGKVKFRLGSPQDKLLHARGLPHSHVSTKNGKKSITRY